MSKKKYNIISKIILAFDDIYEFIMSSSTSIGEEEILKRKLRY